MQLAQHSTAQQLAYAGTTASPVHSYRAWLGELAHLKSPLLCAPTDDASLIHRITSLRKRVDELTGGFDDIKRQLDGERLLHKTREAEWHTLSSQWSHHEKELQDALKQ